MLIVFEGQDKCGKTTQSLKLVEELRKRGETCFHLKFPRYDTPIGKLISQYIKGEKSFSEDEITFLHALDKWQAQEYIRQKLKEGYVVCDRYVLSGLVYSNSEHSCVVNEGLMNADMTFILYKDCQTIVYDKNDIYENLELQEKIIDKYLKLTSTKNMFSINVDNLNIEGVHKKIINIFDSNS